MSTRPLRPERRGAAVTVGARQHFVHRVDLDPDVADVPQALLRILRQAAEQKPPNRHRRRGRQRRPVRLALEDLRDRVRDRVARKRHAPGQHLVEHAAEGPDVGALVDRQAARLLGAHVGGGADDGALAPLPHRPAVRWSGRATTIAADGLGEAEVENLHRLRPA